MLDPNNHVVLMAGGIGSRFWPMSTPQCPKQFIDVLGVGQSLLQLTYARFVNVVPAENVWVLTNRDYAGLVAAQLPQVPADHVLLEPCRRSTAPCIAYASWRIKKLNPKACIAVSPADAIVLDVAEFRRVLGACLEFTATSDAIITLGMRPTRPETGYGYIQADLSAPSMKNAELFRVDTFHEKPDLSLAQRYIEEKDFFWNAGIFIWNVATIVNAYRVYQPAMSQIFERLLPIYGTSAEQEQIDKVYGDCDNISVDYAIMEKADEVFVCPASFGWSDIGSWGALREQMANDGHGNALIGENISTYDCENSIIHTTGKRKVVVEGLSGYIVAEKDDTLLVCRLADEQRIRQFATE